VKDSGLSGLGGSSLEKEVGMKKILKVMILFFAVVIGTGVYFLNSARIIGSGYSAKYLCSQVFLAATNPLLEMFWPASMNNRQ